MANNAALVFSKPCGKTTITLWRSGKRTSHSSFCHLG
jgi:hypothetical protein